MKKLGEVFNDYESGGTIRCAEIEKVTLRKKSKALELKITSNQYIEIKEIERFNNFLKDFIFPPLFKDFTQIFCFYHTVFH